MNFRPAGFSSDEDDFDEFDGFDISTSKSYSNSPTYTNGLGKTRQIINQTISFMDQIKDAIEHRNIDELKQLIKSDEFSINKELDDLGWTPLLYAASLGYSEIINELIDAGADPNLHSDSFTPLMAVCWKETNKDVELVKCADILIEAGANVKTANRYGNTPLMLAASKGHEQLVQKLVPLSSIDAEDSERWTALFHATNGGYTNIVEHLLAMGSKKNKEDIRGQKPEHIAMDKEYTDIFELLKDPETVEIDNITNHLQNQISIWSDLFPNDKDISKPPFFDDVRNFLYGLDLIRYIPVFENHQIGFPQLLTITDGDLETIGVFLPFERRRILHAVHDLNNHIWNRKSVCNLPNKINVYDVLNNLGHTNKHIIIMNAAIEYLNQRFATIKDEKQLNALKNEQKLLLNEIEEAKKHIQTTRKTLYNLNTVVKKIEKNVTLPADYIAVNNFQMENYSFARCILKYSFLTIGLYLLLKNQNSIQKYCYLMSLKLSSKMS